MLIILTVMLLILESIGQGRTDFYWLLDGFLGNVMHFYMNVFAVLLWPIDKFFGLFM